MQDQGACIAVDAMGSDKGPAEVVAAVAMAWKIPWHRADHTGRARRGPRPLVENANLKDHPKLSIQHASQSWTWRTNPSRR